MLVKGFFTKISTNISLNNVFFQRWLFTSNGKLRHIVKTINFCVEVYVPSKSSKESYIFTLMCEGGVVDDRVFSQVTENIIILRNGSAPQSYKDICPVRTMIYGFHDLFKVRDCTVHKFSVPTWLKISDCYSVGFVVKNSLVDNNLIE